MIKEKGQTLITLLVALSVGAVLLIAILGVLANIFRNRSTSLKLDRLTVASENILNEMTQDIHWSEGAIIENGGDRLVLDQPTGEVVYYLEEGKLYKNSLAITGQDIVVTDFSVTHRAPEEVLPLLEVSLILEHSNQEPRVSLEKKTSISLRLNSGLFTP